MLSLKVRQPPQLSACSHHWSIGLLPEKEDRSHSQPQP